MENRAAKKAGFRQVLRRNFHLELENSTKTFAP